MTTRIIIYPKVTDQTPVLLTLDSYDEYSEKIVSCMPDIPIYPNEETRHFMERIFPEGIYEGYNVDSDILVGDNGVKVELEITLPAYQSDEARELRHRLHRFIKDEIRIIEHGY